MVAEAVGGVLSGSLALLADAGHMLADAASLGLALLAAHLARRPPDTRLTYGYHRAEILAATVNAATLLAVGLTVLWEAFRRFASPSHVRWQLVLAVGVPGLAVNFLMAVILNPKDSHNLNVKAAFSHVLTDAFGSLQVILAGTLIAWKGWTWVDPLVSALISLLIMLSGWRILREGLGILMEATPEGLDLGALADTVRGVPGVVGVHDVHVWAITPGFVAASLHLEVEPDTEDDILWRVRQLLATRFGIEHSTIQVERPPKGRGNQLPRYPLA